MLIEGTIEYYLIAYLLNCRLLESPPADWHNFTCLVLMCHKTPIDQSTMAGSLDLSRKYANPFKNLENQCFFEVTKTMSLSMMWSAVFENTYDFLFFQSFSVIYCRLFD